MKRRKMTEKETIESILKLAREQGVEEKVKNIIVKFQDAVKGAKNEEQRKCIAALGIAEIHKTIGCVGNLVVDHIEIIPENTSYKEAINASKSLVNLD
jgi:hypothetical protein